LKLSGIVWTAQLRPCKEAGDAQEDRRLQLIKEEAHVGFLPQPVKKLLHLRDAGGQKPRRPGKIACEKSTAAALSCDPLLKTF
jgi:hypothetical protein